MRMLTAVFTLMCLVIASLVSATSAEAAQTEDVKIAKKAPVEVNDPNFTQIAVSLKVTCFAPDTQIALNVGVRQGDVGGFGFVSSVPCTGKAETVVAHVQSNFGSTFSPGTATVGVTDFLKNLTFTKTITIG